MPTRTEIQRKASASAEIQHRCIQVINDVQEVLENLESPLSFIECCIYKVPDHLRKLKEEHYTPQVISIGPFHHDNRKLQTMEQLKFRYLKYFIRRVENFDISLKDLVSTIMEYEESVRRCYAEAIELSSHEFVKIILVDAIFILELFWRYHFNGWSSDDNGASLEPWLIAAIRFDLILLENQLPFFILEKLFDLAFASHKDYDKSLLTVMAFDYFQFYDTQNIPYSPHLKMKHFLDLLRTFWLPLERLPKRENYEEVVKHVPSATQLHESGLAFKNGSSSCLFDINFKKGVLEMPLVTLDNKSETLYRNLLALEQCHYSDKAYTTDYFILLDFLINTTKDVNFLAQKGILVNSLRNSDEARNLVNSLVENVIYVNMNSDYHRVCKQLKEFYKKSFKIPWDSWMETWRREYLNTPWRTASTFAAIILLVLTLLQTIYTIFPKK